MTETQILSLFGKSLFDGSNPLLLNAILNAPPGLEPVSTETLNKMLRVGEIKISPEIANEPMTARKLTIMVGELFNLVKKEIDKMRRKELPPALIQSKGPNDRPFIF